MVVSPVGQDWLVLQDNIIGSQSYRTTLVGPVGQDWLVLHQSCPTGLTTNNTG